MFNKMNKVCWAPFVLISKFLSRYLWTQDGFYNTLKTKQTLKFKEYFARILQFFYSGKSVGTALL